MKSGQLNGLLESQGVLPRFSRRCRERTPCGSARGMEVHRGPFGRLRAGSSTPPNQSLRSWLGYAQDFGSGLPLRSRPLNASTCDCQRAAKKPAHLGTGQSRIILALGELGVCDGGHG
jgi:hypothetical protein